MSRLHIPEPLLGLLVVTACTGTPSGPPPPAHSNWSTDVATAPEEPPRPTSDAPEPPSPRGLASTPWRSMACGERTYPRTIAFATDASFRAQDLVSPCPPDVDCVWSGIVDREGTYAVAGGSITLTDSSEASPAAKPLPATLEIDAPTGAPVEIAPDGTRCVYTP